MVWVVPVTCSSRLGKCTFDVSLMATDNVIFKVVFLTFHEYGRSMAPPCLRIVRDERKALTICVSALCGTSSWVAASRTAVSPHVRDER
jgi:hypothetical protein